MMRRINKYQQSLAIASKLSDRWGEGAALACLGSAFGSLGRTKEAIEHFQQAIAILHEIGDRKNIATINWNMAISLANLDRHAEAIPLAERSLAYFEEIGHNRVEADRKTIAEWRAAEKANRERGGGEQPVG